MKIVEELLSRRWIIKRENEDLYYQAKDLSKNIKKLLIDKFGYNLIINQYLVKLEKIPGVPEAWMGIQDFKSIQEYQMLCFILMFLEEKEIEEQFVLSNLTEYIQVQFENEKPISWNHFKTRKMLIRVIKYCHKMGIIKTNDGDEDGFIKNLETEVLYENTGISHYFMQNFTLDIMEHQQPDDFINNEWIGLAEDKGIVRRQRVYRKLLLSPGVYRNNDKDEDFAYLRNYRRQISEDFKTLMACQLHLYHSSAYLVLDEDCSLNKQFPSNNALNDLILVVNETLKKQIKNYRLKLDQREQAHINASKFNRLLERVIQTNYQFLPKTYQVKSGELVNEIIEKMELLGFIKIDEEITIYPIIGKISGYYQGGKQNG